MRLPLLNGLLWIGLLILTALLVFVIWLDSPVGFWSVRAGPPVAVSPVAATPAGDSAVITRYEKGYGKDGTKPIAFRWTLSVTDRTGKRFEDVIFGRNRDASDKTNECRAITFQLAWKEPGWTLGFSSMDPSGPWGTAYFLGTCVRVANSQTPLLHGEYSNLTDAILQRLARINRSRSELDTLRFVWLYPDEKTVEYICDNPNVLIVLGSEARSTEVITKGPILCVVEARPGKLGSSSWIFLDDGAIAHHHVDAEEVYVAETAHASQMSLGPSPIVVPGVPYVSRFPPHVPKPHHWKLSTTRPALGTQPTGGF